VVGGDDVGAADGLRGQRRGRGGADGLRSRRSRGVVPRAGGCRESFKAEVRTAADVTGTIVEDGRVRGVVLANGEEIRAKAVVSGIDPKRTLLSLVDPVELGPGLVWRAGNIRTPGVVTKVNLALSGCRGSPTSPMRSCSPDAS
jgi:hypothetical protein